MLLSGSKVVVTGGTGFLGSHVTEELCRAGAKVVAVGGASHDLRQADESYRLLRETRPDAVVHLAAVVGGIGANQADPGRFFYENAIMGIELLEACRVMEVAKVLIAGTVCSYPKFSPVPFREQDLWDGYPEETNAPYGVAKKVLLVQGHAYRDQYGMNLIYLLPVNLYGPRDKFDLSSGHVLPAMILRFEEAIRTGSSTVTLWGDGSPTREFLHVRDAARAFRLALERYDGREPVNVGSGQEISIAGLARVVAEACGFRGRIVWDPSKPNGQPRRRLDTSRARASFGFEACTTLSEGIAETVQWYRSNVRPAVSS